MLKFGRHVVTRCDIKKLLPEIVDVEVEASEHSGHRSDETFIDVEVQIPDARSTEARHPQNDGSRSLLFAL